MKVTLSITTPTHMYETVEWFEGVPYPAVGDHVLFRKNEITWVFQVKARQIGIGTDPRTAQPWTNVRVETDQEAPAHFVP